MNEAIDPVLTEGAVGEKLEAMLLCAKRLVKNYRRGMITDDEFSSCFDREIYCGITDFFKENGFRFALDPRGYSQMAADHERFQKGALPLSDGAWLTHDGESGEGDLLSIRRKLSAYGAGKDQTYRPASAADIARFFEMTDALCLPLSLFRPRDFCGPQPEFHVSHTYHNVTMLQAAFDCVDDGGLLTEPDPAGKRFCLQSREGLTAQVTVTRVRAPEERAMAMDIDDHAPLGAFLAKGSVAGYTAPMPREYPDLVIRTDENGRIFQIGLQMSGEDRKSYLRFPLWQEFFKGTEAFVKKREALKAQWLKSFEV